MSKKKLAFLIFGLAFGVNLLAFIFSNKAYTIDEVKSVWMYELPPSASPFDAYVSRSLGPHQGIIGTFFKPEFSWPASQGEESGIEIFLAKTWTWDQSGRVLTIQLMDGLTYSDTSPILAKHWVDSLVWTQEHFRAMVNAAKWSESLSPEWQHFMSIKVHSENQSEVVLEFSKSAATLNIAQFLKEVLTHPLTGVIHPQQLTALQAGEVITKKWISSGPYKVRQWKPKEIIIVSRTDFPVRLPPEFFRTLRFQSAPVKNPSSDFVQAGSEELAISDKHQVIPSDLQVSVFWMCRSWQEKGSFCSDEKARAQFTKLMSDNSFQPMDWSNSPVRWRIPQGSDVFRAQFRESIQKRVTEVGGSASEVSFFFAPSSESDIELAFVVTSRASSAGLAQLLLRFSNRLGRLSEVEQAGPNLVGQVAQFPISIQMERMNGEIFRKVFLEPDIDEKKMGL